MSLGSPSEHAHATALHALVVAFIDVATLTVHSLAVAASVLDALAAPLVAAFCVQLVPLPAHDRSHPLLSTVHGVSIS